jgi:hypothetical protein
MIAAPLAPERFLGFQLGWLMSAIPDGRGLLATDGASVVRIGHDLRARASYAPSPTGSSWQVLQLVDSSHVLVLVPRSPQDQQWAISLVELDEPHTATMIGNGTSAFYSPTTHLIAVLQETGIGFVYYDPTTHTTGALVSFAMPLASEKHVVLLDPGEPDGAIAAVIAYDTDSRVANVTRLRAIDPSAAKPFQIANTRKVTVTQELLRDRGEMGPELDLDMLVTSRRPIRRRNADESRVVELDDARIVMKDRAGHRMWELAIPKLTHIVWTRDGDLLAYGFSGLARIDPETGQYLERRCGWSFGLWTERVPAAAGVELCEME